MESALDEGVTVMYFAAAQTATKKFADLISLENYPEGLPLSKLGDILVSMYPQTNLKSVLATSQWSVDAKMVDDVDKIILKGGEEVVVVCPVSGG
jgi:molybdopterin converting factor small subunit